jgi:hypothetical protein
MPLYMVHYRDERLHKQLYWEIASVSTKREPQKELQYRKESIDFIRICTAPREKAILKRLFTGRDQNHKQTTFPVYRVPPLYTKRVRMHRNELPLWISDCWKWEGMCVPSKRNLTKEKEKDTDTDRNIGNRATEEESCVKERMPGEE